MLMIGTLIYLSWHVFNMSLNTGQVPAKLITAKVTNVYKTGDRTLPCNYQPKSFLSMFEQLLETLIWSFTCTFLVFSVVKMYFLLSLIKLFTALLTLRATRVSDYVQTENRRI